MKNHINLFLAAISLGACNVLKQLPQTGIPPTEAEMTSGLKEALNNGVSIGTVKLNKRGTFENNPDLKILLPQDIKDVEDEIKGSILLEPKIGKHLGLCEKAMNVAAENAMAKVYPVFKNIVMGMNFNDARGILVGGNGAATNYLRSMAISDLRLQFKPILDNALKDANFYESWNPLITNLNRYKIVVGRTEKFEIDILDYVTQKATEALLLEMEKEEDAIRNNVQKRTSPLLRKVFAYADAYKAI